MRRPFILITAAAIAATTMASAAASTGPGPLGDVSVDDEASRVSVGNTTFLLDTERYPLPVHGIDMVRDLGFGWVEVTVADVTHGVARSLPPLVPNTTFELHAEPLEVDQWNLENTGQEGGTVDADVDITDAWSITTGSSDEVIAIIDSGVDLDHPDLIGQLWTNPGETLNGLDDDGNGYVDDIAGWDMVQDDNTPNDTYGHGTAVATVAAAAVNGVGIAGVAPDATVMPLRVCLASSCSLSAVVEAIDYALDEGATVINLSLGARNPNPALEDAVAAANEAGVMVVTSAGNDGTSNDTWPIYPANIDLPNVIAVAATDRNDDLAVFGPGGSNYGTSVDLAAPGDDLPAGRIGSWELRSGTSFAAPMVAATIALMRTVRPGVPISDLRSIVLSSVDVVPALDGLVATSGRLNAGKAVTNATGPIANATVSPSSGILPFTAELDASASTDLDGTVEDYSWHFPNGSILTGPTVEWDPPAPGNHVVRLDLTDDDGITTSTEFSIYANSRPEAVASIANPIGSLPHLASLSSVSSSDDGGTIVLRTWTAPWSFVQGSTVSFLVPLIGVHDITLEVVDNDGASDTDIVTVFVGADFTDTRESPFRTDIAWLSATGVTKGCNPPLNDRFCPDGTLSRGELAAFVVRYLGLPGTTVDAFDDDADSIFEDDINRLAAAGVTKGCNPPAFSAYCPELDVTRGQLAAMLARSLELPPTSVDAFTDDDDSIFEDDINRLAAAGITAGCNPPTNDAFCGEDPVTRKELAALLRRAST